MDPCDPWLVLRIFFRLKSAGSLFEPSAISSLCLPRREKKPRGLRFDSRSTLKNLRIREKQFTHYLKPHPLVQSSLHQVNQERKVSDSRPQDGFLPAGGLCDNIPKNPAQKYPLDFWSSAMKCVSRWNHIPQPEWAARYLWGPLCITIWLPSDNVIRSRDQSRD